MEEFEVGPRAELVEAFASYREKVLELDAAGELAEALHQSHPEGLGDLARRFYGWIYGEWDLKAQKVRRLFAELPRPLDVDWRQLVTKGDH